MRLVMLDRDGVLNEDRADYVKTPDELKLIPGAARAVARLNAAGLRVAVVTNQGCCGRGLVSEPMLKTIHEKLAADLARENARLDALIVCPDHPERPGPRRKPSPGMLREALDLYALSPDDAVMVGDSLRDLEAAAAIGCARILVRTGQGRKTLADGLPLHVQPADLADDLGAAVDLILAGTGATNGGAAG